MFLDKFFLRFEPCPLWHQLNEHLHYYRRFNSVNHERKRFVSDKEFEHEFGYKLVRRKRGLHFLNSWITERVATCYTTKSWKKLYRVKKQYMKIKYQDEKYFEIVK